MSRLSVEAHYGGRVDLDCCQSCQGLWFDHHEDLQLTPVSTLRLFEVIHGNGGARQPLGTRLTCPRCQRRLAETNDRQRNTPFRYWRCIAGHGRFITFFDFLREKDFVRPLDPPQLTALKDAVRSVNCSNCGAPIDLAQTTVCAYCRTPLSMLDFERMGRMVRELAESETRQPEGAVAKSLDPALALALLRERRQLEAAFSRYEHSLDWSSLTEGRGLVEAGIGAVVELLRKLR
jgi:hypothetical protein